MEKFELTLESQQSLSHYIADNHVMAYERAIFEEIAGTITRGESDRLAWYAGFGDSFRQIAMNLNVHRHALEFGFSEIAFDQYGWFAAPEFLERETIALEQSEIRLGRGANHLWVYSLSCTYGTAGSSGPLCVFNKKFNSRESALTAALEEMKTNMTKYLGNSDTTNYKQDILNKTLKLITLLKVDLVQLSLF